MNNIDIHKIIDDAIEKKDRSVTIFITGENMSICVNPLDEPARWIKTAGATGLISKCSNCGTRHSIESQYCPDCGEKLKLSE